MLESVETTSELLQGSGRWLVHLVGDLHQPMHVTTGYYKTTAALKKAKVIGDPENAT